MASLAAAFGFGNGTAAPVPNYVPYFFIFAFFWTHIITAARPLKKTYGIDSNASPRDDLARFGEQAVKNGKITRSQLNMVKRNEAAHANAFEALPIFVGTVLLATIAKVPNEKTNRICAIWAVLRIAYHVFYLTVERGLLSYLRGVCFWAANLYLVSLLWQTAKILN